MAIEDDLENAQDAVRRFGAESDEAQQALRKVTSSSENASDGLAKMGRSLQGFAGGLARGQTSISNLSGVVNGIRDMVKSIPGIGAKAGAAVDLLTDGMVVALEQMDKALGTFYNLGQIGALGADGVDNLRKNMVEMGVPLDQFNKIIQKNTKALIGLTGSASETAENLSGMVGTLRAGLDMELRLLGFTTDEVSDTLASYANIQRRLGAEQNLNQGKLIQGTVKFGKELDLLAKVTGTSREQQQSNLDAALREGRYLAATRQLEAQGAGAAAQELNKFMLVVQDISPTLGAAIKDTAGGFISTQSAQQGFISTGGALPGIISGLKSGQLDYAQAVQQIQDATKTQLPAMESINLAVGDATGAFVPLNESVNLTTYAMGDLESALKRASALQEAQTAMDTGGVTAELVSASKNLEEASSKLQATVFSSDLLSGGIDNFVEVINAAANGIYSAVGTMGDYNSIQEEYRELTNETKLLREEIHSLRTRHIIGKDFGGKDEYKDMWGQMSTASIMVKQNEENLASMQKRLNALSKQLELSKHTQNPTLTNYLQQASDIAVTDWVPDMLNVNMIDTQNLNERLKDFQMVPTQTITPGVQTQIDEVINKFEGFKNNPDFFKEIKKIIDQQNNTNNTNVQGQLESNNKVVAKLDELINLNRDGNSTRDNMAKRAYTS